MAEEQQGGFYRVEVIASLFGVTVRRVQQLTQEGIISTTKTKEGNRYELAPTIQRYVKYLSDKAYGKSKSEKEAELREQKLQAEIALKESQVIKQLCGGRLHTGRNGKEKAWQEIRIVDTRSQNTRRKP